LAVPFSLFVGVVVSSVLVAARGNSLDSQTAIGAGLYSALAAAAVVLPTTWAMLALQRRYARRPQALAWVVVAIGLTVSVGFIVGEIAMSWLVVARPA
jgi:hypothetical protein